MRTLARTLAAGLVLAGIATAAHAAEAIEGPKSRTIQLDGQEIVLVDAAQLPARPMNQASPIPEPSHMAMYGLVVAGLLYRRFRRPTPEATS